MMSKNIRRNVFLILALLFLNILISPIVFAEQFGSIAGKVSDKNGDPVSDAYVECYDNYSKLIATTSTDDSGSFSFDKVPIVSSYGCDNYKLKVSLEKDGKDYGQLSSLWFVVYPLRCTEQNFVFDNYPPSGMGRIYGVVSDESSWISSVPATIYMDTGMYAIYNGRTTEPWQFWLPVGNYDLWAERNVNGITYVSDKINVNVQSDQDKYVSVFCPLTKNVSYHEQPSPCVNIVKGVVSQKYNMPLPDVNVELCKVDDNKNLIKVKSASSDVNGLYEFYGIDVMGIYDNYCVRFIYDINGKEYVKTSDVFRIYYANTLGVSHTTSVNINFDIVNTGSLEISSDPEGAYIWMDGFNTSEKTPCTLTKISIGGHHITLKKEGFYDDNFDIEVSPEAITNINRTLQQNTGNLFIILTPADASVYLNDEYAGDGSMVLEDKPCGTYSYLISCDGYNNETGNIDVQSGKISTLNVNMVATPGLTLTYFLYLLNNVVYTIGKVFSD